MNLRKRSMLASGLVALATAVWIPAFSSGKDEASVPRAESAADGGVASPSSALASAAPTTATGASTPEAPLAGLDALSRLEAGIVALDAEGEELDLASLLSGLDAGEEQVAVPLTSVPLELEVDGREVLEDFVARHALTGVLHGPDGAFALLGHRVVRAGQVLEGGRIRVQRIEPLGLELGAGGATYFVELPGFQARTDSAPDHLPSEPQPAPGTAPEPASAPQPAAVEKGAGA